MKKVHYALLADMEKYLPNFNSSEYESSTSTTDPDVISQVREIYSENLPVDLTAWTRVNHPDPDRKFIYEKSFYTQINFIGEVICELLFPNYEDYMNNLPVVISTHYSKSICLPVYKLYVPKYHITFILRDNFYDWKISVESETSLDYEFMGLFKKDERINSCYCEGFPSGTVYGSFNDNNKKFTIELESNYELYMFMYMLNYYLQSNQK